MKEVDADTLAEFERAVDVHDKFRCEKTVSPTVCSPSQTTP